MWALNGYCLFSKKHQTGDTEGVVEIRDGRSSSRVIEGVSYNLTALRFCWTGGGRMRRTRNFITKWNRRTDRARERRQAEVMGAVNARKRAAKPVKVESEEELVRQITNLRKVLERIPDYEIKTRTAFYDGIERYQRALRKIQARRAKPLGARAEAVPSNGSNSVLKQMSK
jgi:hypothetical protein